MIDRAVFSGVTIFEALLENEWNGYHRIRKVYDSVYEKDRCKNDHTIKHIVLKKGGATIVGAAQVSFVDQGTQKWQIDFCAIDLSSDYSFDEAKARLLRWCAK
jgi:hypothetical protein